MEDDRLEAKIANLGDKDAVSVASNLVEHAFRTVSNVPPEEFAGDVTNALATMGIIIQPSAGDQWLDTDLPPEEAGPLARSLLLTAANNCHLASIIRSEIAHPDNTMDLGAMAALVPVALMYVLVATEVKYEDGKLTIVKRAMSPKEMTALLKALPQAAIDKVAAILGSDNSPA